MRLSIPNLADLHRELRVDELHQASTDDLVQAAHALALRRGADPVGRQSRLTRIQHELHRRGGGAQR